MEILKKNKTELWIGTAMHVIFVKTNWLIKAVRYCDNTKGELVRKFTKLKWIMKLKMNKDYNITSENGTNHNVLCVHSTFYLSISKHFTESLNHDFYGGKWPKK